MTTFQIFHDPHASSFTPCRYDLTGTFYTQHSLKVAAPWSMNRVHTVYLLNWAHRVAGHRGRSRPGQTRGPVKTFLSWEQSLLFQWMKRTRSCRRIGRGVALQTVQRNKLALALRTSQSRWYHSDTAPPPLPSIPPLSLCRNSLDKLYKYLCDEEYIECTPNPRPTSKAAASITGKDAKEDLRGLLRGSRSWYGWRWNGVPCWRPP